MTGISRFFNKSKKENQQNENLEIICPDCNDSKRITLLTSIVDCERCKQKPISETKTNTNQFKLLENANIEELKKELLLIKARQTKLKEQNKEKIEKWKLENLSGNGYDEIRTVGLNIGTTFSTGEWSSVGEWSAPLAAIGTEALKSFRSRTGCYTCTKGCCSSYCSECKGTKKITLLNSIVNCEKCS